MCLYFTDIKSTSKAPFIQQSLCNTDWFIVWFCHYSRCQSSTEHICTDGESSDCRVDYGQQSPLAADEGSISECGNHSLSEGRGEIGYDSGLNIFSQTFTTGLWQCWQTLGSIASYFVSLREIQNPWIFQILERKRGKWNKDSRNTCWWFCCRRKNMS